MTRATHAFDFDAVVDRVRAHGPDLARKRGRHPAATALVLHDHENDGPRVLFMERTARAGDRWSGHMSLPGGRRDPVDADLEATARRETLEEVGVDPGPAVGRLDDQGTRTSGVVVATFVYAVEHQPEIVPNPVEVNTTVWIPVRALAEPQFAAQHPYRGTGPFPAITYEGCTIWGLTRRIVTHFLEVVR